MVYNRGHFKMKKHLILLSTLVLFAFCSCGKFAGNPITKDFSVTGAYTALEVEDAFEVTVSDVATQVTVTAGENIMPKVVVEIIDNTMKIYLKGITHANYGTDMKVVIPFNAGLVSVDLSGASEFHSEYGLEGKKVEVDLSGASDFFGDILADEIEMDLSGASNIKGNVYADELDIELSGASDATLEGEVGTLEIDLTGASNIKKTINGNRYGFVCDRCEGSMSGASNGFIHCDGTIKVSLSGASDLHYTGNATTTGCNTTGASGVYHDVL